ncbi:MAG TPA: tetratricopeptide repeat protein [Gemmatimonadaceae bacterium]|nr:tetratricopeptide repeat protein [Gemmatimonadaceae bacterium]
MKELSRAEWDELSRLLDEALDIAPEHRAAWLGAQGAGRPRVIAELEALLNREAAIDAAGFLDPSHAPPRPALFTLAGQTLGAYVLERPIGEGGMGSVWLARRSDGRFEGAAAIKFLSLAVAGPIGEARFRREGSVLARLSHPNIARLLDAGVSSTGLPYLVLEFIAGKPIDEWCDTHALSIDARLHLFQQVLAAVAHAHANFIVHRDLKPDNILVTDDGTVKLLDFGIAKLLDEESITARAVTSTRGGAFTYKYAAPEQIQGEPITTRADVYALGVILYELLAGRHPTSGSSMTPAEYVVATLNTEPPPMSIAPTSARLRGALAGDLDNIAAKALKKDPAERYPTVEAMAEDIRRHLNDEPVSARADSFSYRARKFVKRNRVPVAVGALVMLGLVSGVLRERQLRARAESEARKAVAVESYLVGIFGAADPFAPSVGKPSDVTARALLDRGADRMDTSLVDQPDVRAELRGALGSVYANLGVYDKAALELRRALTTRRALYGADNAEVAESMDQLGEVLVQIDSLAEADTLLRAALATRRKLFGDRSEATATSLMHLAILLQNRDDFTRAEPLFREALAIRRGLYGDGDTSVATSRDFLGQLLQAKNANADALAEYREALAIRRLRLGAEHPATAQTMHDMAAAEENLGKYREAEQDYRAALAIERRTLGSEHRSVTLSLNDLGQMLFKLGRLEEADSLLREALALNRRLFGENHEAVSANLANLALIVRERGDFDEAERLLEQALAVDRKLYGAVHMNIGFDMNEIAVVLRLRGRPDSAIAVLRPTLAMTRQLQGDQLATQTIIINLGRALDEAHRYDEAEQLLRGALAKLDTNNANAQLSIIPARVGLGRVLLHTRRAAEALPIVQSAVTMSRALHGADHWRTGEAELVLAECLIATGDRHDAGEPLRTGREALMKQGRAHPLLVTEANATAESLTRR